MKNFENPPKNNDPEMTRRGFLKFLGETAATAAVIGGGYKIGKTLKDVSDKFEKKQSGQKEEVNKIIEKNEGEDEDISEAEEFEREDFSLTPEEEEIMKEIFHPDIRNHMDVGIPLIETLTKYQIDQYKKEGAEVERELAKMKPYEPFLKEQFAKNRVSERMMYLAIPESSWRPKKPSTVGAIGYYQIMPGTALLHYRKKPAYRNMKDAKILEIIKKDLLDLKKNATLAAEIMGDNLKKAHGNEDLALAGYNGSFIWGYLAKCNKLEKDPKYEEFLNEVLEKKINEIRLEILSKDSFSYTIKNVSIKDKLSGKTVGRRPETLGEICLRYKISFKDIRIIEEKKKGIKKQRGGGIRAGTKLLIKLDKKTEEEKMRTKQIRYREKVAGLMENLRYPSKYWAIIAVIFKEYPKYFSGHGKSEGDKA